MSFGARRSREPGIHEHGVLEYGFRASPSGRSRNDAQERTRSMKIRDIDVFQVSWAPGDAPQQRSAFVQVHTEDGLDGIGEASPMQGGLASLGIIARDIAPMLIGQDPLDHAVLLDTAFHRFAKLGPEGALTGALAALDIALWDVKGKFLGQPIYKLLGGAWRTSLPFYASIGGNGERSLDQVLRVVEGRLKDNPTAVKIRFDNRSEERRVGKE